MEILHLLTPFDYMLVALLVAIFVLSLVHGTSRRKH